MNTAIKIAAALAVLGAAAPSALADGDAVAGKTVFKKCATCHDATEAKDKVGPHLVGVIGRVAGTVESFDRKYSKNIKELGQEGLTWDEETLAAYLRKPKDVVPKGKMAFPGLKEDADIANVIEYLKADQKP